MKFNLEDIKLLKIVALVALAVASAVVTIGVLAVPVVMSIVYSWCWMLLYVGYLAVGLMGLYIISRK